MAPRGRKPRSVVPACTGTVSIQERASEVGQDPKTRNCWAARDAGSGGRPQRRGCWDWTTGQLIKLISVITTATAAQFLSWFDLPFFLASFWYWTWQSFFCFGDDQVWDGPCGMAWILVGVWQRYQGELAGALGDLLLVTGSLNWSHSMGVSASYKQP